MEKPDFQDTIALDAEAVSTTVTADNNNNVKNKNNATPLSSDSDRRSLDSFCPSRLFGVFQCCSMLLNAGLMVYAHVGTSAVIFSSRPPLPPRTDGSGLVNFEGSCNTDDYILWTQGGGKQNRTVQSNFCSRQYGTTNGCLLNSTCVAECFHTVHGYSPDCSLCFAELPMCSFSSGCGLICARDSLGPDCQQCNIPCTLQLDVCMGFALEGDEVTTPSTFATSSPSASTLSSEEPVSTVASIPAHLSDSCVKIDLDSIDQFYIVYDLTFVDSVRRAWNGDVKLLAFIVVIFSGIWPYAKNIILIIAWYLPMTARQRTWVLLWLKRLSKYTLVDVFAVITILVGTLLQMNVGGTLAVTRAEPRGAIIAFFVATLWEFLQIEWTVQQNEHHLQNHPSEQNRAEGGEQEGPQDKDSFLGAMRFRTDWIHDTNTVPCRNTSLLRIIVSGILLLTTIALFVAGSMSEMVYFTSSGTSDSAPCKKSFNLVTLGNEMISDLALTQNDAIPAVWTLYIAYMLLVLIQPMAVHLVQILILLFDIRHAALCRFADMFWGFASVEVLLMGVFVIEYRFEKFVAFLAGRDNADFFQLTAELGVGFYLLIIYSILAGLLGYFLNCAAFEYHQMDPYHKVHHVWTKILPVGFSVAAADS